jgi:hypothetical protein
LSGYAIANPTYAPLDFGVASNTFTVSEHRNQITRRAGAKSLHRRYAAPSTEHPDEASHPMTLYDTDFYAWAEQQTKLLRSGQLAQADIEHIAEEIESMGRREKRELLSRLAILLMHLLKWQVQPMLRGNSWRATIKVQRRDIERHLADNPSLKAKLPEILAAAYGDATLLASRETGLPEASFPPSLPWSFEQIMDGGFWPEDGDAA